MVYLLIAARDIPSSESKKGHIIDVRKRDVLGSKEILPNFIQVAVSDATKEQVDHFLSAWHIKYTHKIIAKNANGYRIKVEVDPIYISASGTRRAALKDSMQSWVESYGGVVQNYTSESMTFDITKGQTLAELKRAFDDIFEDMLDIKRYYFKSAAVNAVVNNGGFMEVTRSQVLSYIQDKLEL